MKDKNNNSKQRAFSLLKTIGSTALKAGNEALRKKLNMSDEEDFSISKAALRLTKGLDELKGAAMKIGQMLSMMDEHLLPKGWKEALSKLQAEATPRPWAEIEPLLIAEFGNLNAFSSIDKEAVHAASIAQVHTAVLKNGTKVAVKIQYPGLEKNIKSDLASMKKLIHVANIMPNMANYDHIFSAMEKMFKQELDFEREKKFYDLYHEKFKNNEDIVVPQTIAGLCSKTILVTEWVEGVNLQRWMDANLNHPCKNKIGALLLEVVFTEILLLNQIQSDPNPGNFLVTKDNKLALLDFGATQTLSQELGYIETGDTDEVRDSFVRIIQLVLEPFLNDTYSWLDCSLTKRIHAESFVFMKQTKYRAPSGEILFMNRRLAGNLMMMEKLAPSFAAREIFLRLLQEREDACSP
jgi:aarF domain-containing kinase